MTEPTIKQRADTFALQVARAKDALTALEYLVMEVRRNPVPNLGLSEAINICALSISNDWDEDGYGYLCDALREGLVDEDGDQLINSVKPTT